MTAAVGLHYSGGWWEDTSFKGAVAPATHACIGPGDDVFLYPSSHQTYRIGDSDDSDAEPTVSVTGDGVAMYMYGQAYFTLNTDPTALRAFHERIGVSSEAYINGGRDGWGEMLRTYLLPAWTGRWTRSR